MDTEDILRQAARMIAHIHDLWRIGKLNADERDKAVGEEIAWAAGEILKNGKRSK